LLCSRLVYPVKFFLFFDAIFTIGPASLGKDLQADLLAQYPVIKVFTLYTVKVFTLYIVKVFIMYIVEVFAE
jgi:hypothetical protein